MLVPHRGPLQRRPAAGDRPLSSADGVVRASTVIALATQISPRVLPLRPGRRSTDPGTAARRGDHRWALRRAKSTSTAASRRPGAEHRGSPHASPPSHRCARACPPWPPPALRHRPRRARPGSAGASAAEVPLSAPTRRSHDRLAIRSLGADPRQGPGRAVVTDAATGQVVWAHTPTEAQIPASNAKILTAVNALEAFGPTHTFTTSVMTGSTARRIVLVGGGDPSLSARQLGGMARTTAAGLAGQGRHPGPGRGRRLALPGAHLGARLEADLHDRGRLTGARPRRRPPPPVGHLAGRRHRLRPQAGEVGPGRTPGGPRRAAGDLDRGDRVARPRPGHPDREHAARPATTTSPRVCTGWSPCRPASPPPGPAPRPRRRPR